MQILIWGYDGTDWHEVKVDSDGHLQIDALSVPSPITVTQTTPANLTPGIYGWTGSAWVQISVDASGHLQVDVLSNALPSGAAIETKQDTMITALQLIDDLRNALGSVNTDDLQVDVKTSALPSGAATEATLAFIPRSLIVKANSGSAVANLGKITLWTPASGKKFNLMGWVIGASVAGELELWDKLSAQIADVSVMLLGNASASFGSCYYTSAAANNTLDLYNITGGAANLFGTAWGFES